MTLSRIEPITKNGSPAGDDGAPSHSAQPRLGWVGALPARALASGLLVTVALAGAGYVGAPDEPVFGLSILALGLVLSVGATAFLAVSEGRLRRALSAAAALQHDNADLERRIRAQEQLAEGMHQNELKYQAIYQNAVGGIFQQTPEGRFLNVNPAMARIFGYDSSDEFIAITDPDSHDMLVEPSVFAEFVRQATEQEVVRGFEAEVMRKDGRLIWISIAARAMRDEAGAILYLEGTVEDITERKEAEAALRLAKEHSDLSSRSKSEFLANMSHELRTPLNAIIGFSEIIKDQMFGAVGQPNYVEYSRDIYESGKLLLALINDILDMSKIEAGKKELSEAVLDVSRAAMSCLRLVRPRAEARQLTLTSILPPDLPCIRAEELALKQILSNLLTNAIKFTPEGGTVTLSAGVESDGRFLIVVSDTGIGIAPGDIAKCLQPFGQIESSLSRKTEGTGLGLPLVKSLVELHEGNFHLDSTLGKGTNAMIWLPTNRVIHQV